jgi:hypothetical protein
MNNILKKTAFIYGLIGFVITVTAYFIMWFVDLKLFLNPLVTYPLSIIVIVLGLLSQLKVRKSLQGFISFGNALLSFVITIAIALLGFIVAGILIFNVIDPSAKEKLLELTIQASIEMSNKMLEYMGLEQAAGQISEEDLRASMALSPTPFGIPSLLFGYFGNMAIFTVIGLISSLIIKKNKEYEFE